MKLLITIFISLITSISYSQEKQEIISKLRETFKNHCISTVYRDSDILYNSEEKILELGDDRIDLDLTNFSYRKTREDNSQGIEEEVHILEFTCLDGSNTCIKNHRNRVSSSAGALFDEKEYVYKVIFLIYQLKDME